MAFPHDLLKQAYLLANKEKKSPKQASLRRAISTGYYALFHLLIDETVRKWAVEHQWSALGRTFDHRTMKSVCEECIKNFYISGAAETGKKLKSVAQAFTTMQQKRHLADYDIALNWERADVIGALDVVSEAFKDWRDIREQREAQDFLLQLLLPKVFKLREA